MKWIMKWIMKMIFDELYNTDSTGKTRTWRMEQDNDKHRTISGVLGGKLVYSEWTTCVAKNVGKFNSTSPEIQATKEIAALYTKQKKKGYYASGETQKVVLKPTLSLEYNKEKHNLFKNNRKVFVSGKMDGIRFLLTKDGAFSRKTERFTSCPHIEESFKDFFKVFPDVMIDGEIYNHDLKDDFEELVSIVKKQKAKPEDLEISKNIMQYHVFDVKMNGDYSERMKFIKDHLTELPYVVVHQHFEVKNFEELDKKYDDFLDAGYEGMMIREDVEYVEKRTKHLLKRKEFFDMEAEIVELLEGTGNRSNMVGKVLLKLPNGELCKANIKGGYEYYKKLWLDKDYYVGKLATVKYQGITKAGVLRFPCVKEMDRTDV